MREYIEYSAIKSNNSHRFTLLRAGPDYERRTLMGFPSEGNITPVMPGLSAKVSITCWLNLGLDISIRTLVLLGQILPSHACCQSWPACIFICLGPNSSCRKYQDQKFKICGRYSWVPDCLHWTTLCPHGLTPTLRTVCMPLLHLLTSGQVGTKVRFPLLFHQETGHNFPTCPNFSHPVFFLKVSRPFVWCQF